MNKYYANYDKDIISTRGGGKIVQIKPANRNKQSGIISDKFKPSVKYSPPLAQIKYRDNKILSNGYHNPNSFMELNDNSTDYYYTSQQMNNTEIISREDAIGLKGEILNINNPIKSPPSLVTTEPMTEKEKLKEILKAKLREEMKKKIMERVNEVMLINKIKKGAEIEKEIKNEIRRKEKKEYLDNLIKSLNENKSWISEDSIYSIKTNKNLDNLIGLDLKRSKGYMVNLCKNDENKDNFENIEINERKEDKDNTDYFLIIVMSVILAMIVMYFILKYRN